MAHRARIRKAPNAQAVHFVTRAVNRMVIIAAIKGFASMICLHLGHESIWKTLPTKKIVSKRTDQFF